MTALPGFRRFAVSALLLAFAAAFGAVAPPAAHAQTITIAEARSQGGGSTVTVEGVVTRAFDSFVRFQDESGATGASGLVVRQTSGDFRDDILDGTIARGTEIQVTGTLSEFNGLLQINEADLADYSVEGQTSVPAPQDVTLDDIEENGGDYESELVRVTNVRFPNASGTFGSNESYDGTDGTATVVFRIQGEDQTELVGESVPEGAFTYTGVVGVYFPDFFNSPDYQLIPIRSSDFQGTASAFFPGRSYALAYETGGEATASVQVRVTGLGAGETVTIDVGADAEGDADLGDVSGFDDQLTFTGSGTQTLSLNATADGQEEGIERLELTLSTDDGNVAATPARFTVWILDDPAAQTTLFPGLEGVELRAQLRDRFASGFGSQPGPPTLGYDVARDTLYSSVFNENGIVTGYYTGFEVDVSGSDDPTSDLAAADINTEHVWPRSRGAENEPALSNMHILVPARADVNSARSNYAFDDIPDPQTDTWYFEDQSQSTIPESNIDAWSEADTSPGNRENRSFEPREIVQGDVARKSFYFAMAYPGRADGSFLSRQQAVLRSWNAEDPVDALEQRRNVQIASQQGDQLNPFQLDSTLVRRAFFADDDGGGGDGDVLTIAQARGRLGGTVVTVEGVFTRIEGRNARIQDTSGPTGASGIVVRDQALADAIDAGDVEPGDRLRVTGPLDEFNNLRQINNQSDAGNVSYEVIQEDAGLPAAQTITLSEAAMSGEDYESELVRVEGLTIASDGDDVFQGGGAAGNYIATGPGGGEITLRIPGSSFYVGEPIPDEEVTFEGVLGQFGTGDPANGYQLQAIAEGDLEEGDGGGGDGETIEINIARSFGDPDASTGYRLVALPGDVNRPIENTLDGDNGSDWQAFRDDGSDTDFFVEWDDSEAFDFRPGRGFWLIAEEDWTVQATVSTVETASDGSYTIDLQDGWNIFSNPLADDADWSTVESANGLDEPIWRFDGSYAMSDVFLSAVGGEAFYFNNETGLDELTIPASATSAAVAASAPEGNGDEAEQTLVLTTYRNGMRTSVAYVGTADGAAAGLDVHDALAPPAGFEAASLRLPLPAGAVEDGRHGQLAIERRAPGRDGYTFDLVLNAEPSEEGGAVTLRAGSLADFGTQPVRLVETLTGREHDLRTAREVTITPEQGGETNLRLLIGSAASGTAGLPDEVTLRPGYPNPFREDVTLEYALPEAADVRVTVYDLLGRRVRTLADGRREAGPHTLQWDGRGAGSTPLASGVYFIRLEAGDTMRSEKVVRVK